MARKIEIEIIGDASSFHKALGQATDTSSKFGSSLGKLAKRAALIGGAAGLGAMVLGVKHAVNAASDLNESVNAVNVVFGKSSKQIQNFSKKAVREAGLSMREFNESVTPIGAALQNVGFSSDQAAKSSIALTKRAADLASVFNTDVGTALEAVQAALRGESDPIEKFGIGLNEAALKAAAAKEGMTLLNGELSASQKTHLRLAEIMRQSNKVQGDFKNTSGGFANALRILKGTFENISAHIGAFFLPLAARVVSWAVDVLPALQNLGAKLLHWLAPAFDAVKHAIRKVIDIVPEIVAAFAERMGPSMDSAKDSAIKLGQRLGDLAQTNFQALKESAPGVVRALDNIKQALENLGVVGQIFLAVWSGGIYVFLKFTLPNAIKGVSQVLEAMSQVFLAVSESARRTFNTMVHFILGDIDKFLGGLQLLFDAAAHIPGIGDKFKGVATAIGNARERIRDLDSALTTINGKHVTVYVDVAETLIKSIGNVGRVRQGQGGHRAAGGPVRGGEGYIVGERGPEYFMPGRDGTIIPNHRLGGGMTVNLYAPNYIGSKQELLAELQNVAQRYFRQNGRSAFA